MLHLAVATEPDWGRKALAHVDEILLDHAHLEKKAAGTAVNLLFRYSSIARLAQPLSEVAREELAHFELVLGHLQQRGLPYKAQRAAPYAGQLRLLVRSKEPEQLLDLLLCSTLIEARSCERMQLLSEALEDEPLRALYAGLLRAEARHHALYLELAEALYPRAEVRERLQELAQGEAKIIAEAPSLARMHASLS